jgi:hypothetical protein
MNRPLPFARQTLTFLAPGDDHPVTFELIVVHDGGGLPDGADTSRWETLPESGHAGWNRITNEGEFVFYGRALS